MDLIKKKLPSIKQLTCFLAVAQELNFNRAAQRLDMSQPPLSRHIQALEHSLGIALFSRDTHSVHLTEAGKRLEPLVRQWLRDLSNDLESIQIPNHGLRIGVTRMLNLHAMPAFQPLFTPTALAPHTLVHHLSSTQLLDAFKHHHFDVVIIAEHPHHRADWHLAHVYTESMLMVLPSHHAASKAAYFDFDASADLPLFWFKRQHSPSYYDECEAALKLLTQPLIRIPEPDDSLIMLAQVAQGQGMALMPSSMCGLIQQNLSYLALHPKYQGAFDLKIFLLTRALAEHPQQAAFIEQLKQALATPTKPLYC
ncbi:MAG: LysR family transcriptional regulator [Neisseriaceae bacterium]|nr:LysR family transcriptional regulator [Neisseriaceae bacterium]